ncbi:MAG TPA: cytochrome c oxidase subunit 4 [Acidimicrobiales bacterium]|nr:cytochrome c oxidase subunit 4 [Acidimicrobiales bacterium]
MKHEAYFLLFIAAFGAVVAFIFWAVGLSPVYLTITGGGTIMLVAVSLLGLLPGGYYLWWSKRMTPRAEDDEHAEPSDGAGVVAAFPSSSIWPFVLGLGAAFIALALVFGFWTAIFGFFLVITALVGVIIESRRGGAEV